MVNFNIPVYRFLSKQEYADAMINNGIVRFTPIKAFNNHEDPSYKDDDEGGHFFKDPVQMHH